MYSISKIFLKYFLFIILFSLFSFLNTKPLYAGCKCYYPSSGDSCSTSWTECGGDCVEDYFTADPNDYMCICNPGVYGCGAPICGSDAGTCGGSTGGGSCPDLEGTCSIQECPGIQGLGLKGQYFLGFGEYGYDNPDAWLDCSAHAGEYACPINTQRDPIINFDWPKRPVPCIGCGNYAVRWTGYVYIPSAGTYGFRWSSDDGSRFWIDNQPIECIDDDEGNIALSSSCNWYDHCYDCYGVPWGVKYFSSSGWHPVKLEYYNRWAEGKVSLMWFLPDQWWNWQVIPSENLRACSIPEPSCTVIPTTLNLVKGQTATLTAQTTTQEGGVVGSVIFTSENINVATRTPQSDSTVPFTTQVTATGVGTTRIQMDAYLTTPGKFCTGFATINVIDSTKPWYQTMGGDVHAQDSISSTIPYNAIDKYFSLDSSTLNGYPGVVSLNNSVNFGPYITDPLSGVKISTKNWLAKSDYNLSKFNYSYFYNKFETSQMINTNGAIPGDIDGIYYIGDDKDLVINNKMRVTKNLVIFVDNNLIIDKEIDVEIGGSLVFIVQGYIEIKDSFGVKGARANDGFNADVEGIFITNGEFRTGSGSESGKRLLIGGVVKASSFRLLRDLKNNVDDQNSLYPAELFIYRPDLILKSNHLLWPKRTIWQEVAP